MKKILFVAVFVSALNAGALFHKGALSLGLGLGSGSVNYSGLSLSATSDYLVFGVGADYFVLDDLSVGFGVTSWFGDDPTIVQLSLPVTYYIDTKSKIHPYIGTFYRYTDYIGDVKYMNGITYNVESSDAVGVRIGIAYRVGFGYAGVGYVSEKNLDSKHVSGYPEFRIGFIF